MRQKVIVVNERNDSRYNPRNVEQMPNKYIYIYILKELRIVEFFLRK